MKKYFSLLLVAFTIASQETYAQLDLAFISTFNVTSDKLINHLNWTVANNQGANSFIIEKSTNGKDFASVAVLTVTEKLGTESYVYSDTVSGPEKIMYRLRILTDAQHSFYSRIFIVQPTITADYSIKIIGHPVADKVSFNYTSKNVEPAEIKIYNLYGQPILNNKINCFKGNNFITLPLNSSLSPGTYIIQVNNSILSLTTKFIKQ